VKSCFLLWHTHSIDKEEGEKLIGAYASSSEAEAAIQRLKDKRGFREYPDGFEIAEYEIGKDHWTEGFITWEEAEGDSK
jgi:hypothetical protein